MKQPFKKLDRGSKAFWYQKDLYSRSSPAKLKAGVFVEPQILAPKLRNDLNDLLNVVERSAWTSLVAVTEEFVRNHKANNYQDLTRNLVRSFAIVFRYRLPRAVH